MNEPQTEYKLVRTLTGNPVAPKPNGPVILEDKEGNKLRAPYPPRASCKSCYGRGFIGKDVKTNQLLPCRKCYPLK